MTDYENFVARMGSFSLNVDEEEEIKQSDILSTPFADVDEDLIHYGVKGMKWGVRRSQEALDRAAGRTPRNTLGRRYSKIRKAKMLEIETTTKNGVSVKAIQEPTGRVSAFLASLSKRGVENVANLPYFTIEAGGKKVGQALFARESSDEISLQWLGIKSSERGQGYGSAIFDAAIKYAKAEGVSKLTLEVPGTAPDARHIYEKRGFKVTKKPSILEPHNFLVWRGLTTMELDLTEESIRHANLSEDEELELALEQTFTQLTESQEEFVFGKSDDKLDPDTPEEEEIKQSDILSTPFADVDEDLIHYGVKGMKWGVRRSQEALDRAAGRTPRRSQRRQARQEASARKQDRRTASRDRGRLSDDELQSRIKRIRLERELKTLTEQEVNPGKTFVANAMKDVGKQAITAAGVGLLFWGIRAALDGNERNAMAMVRSVLQRTGSPNLGVYDSELRGRREYVSKMNGLSEKWGKYHDGLNALETKIKSAGGNPSTDPEFQKREAEFNQIRKEMKTLWESEAGQKYEKYR